MKNRLPTLVTYRSAVELRDAGIRYAYLKAGMHAGLLAGIIAGGGAQYLFWVDSEFVVIRSILLIVALFAIAIGAYCGRIAEFPQCPRLTLEELEAMQNDMGLSREIFEQTNGSVLHGSFEEHRAIEQTDAILAQVKQTVARQGAFQSDLEGIRAAGYDQDSPDSLLRGAKFRFVPKKGDQ